MNGARSTVLAATLIGLMLAVVGCTIPDAPTSGASSPADSQKPAATAATDDCGISIIRELADEGYFPTRAEAITATLEWHRGFGSEAIEAHSGTPRSVYIDLLAAALLELPGLEQATGADELLRIEPAGDGDWLGWVEIGQNADGRYGLEIISIPSADPEWCDEDAGGESD